MCIREQIIDAFANTPPPERIAIDTYDDEDTTDYFTGTDWRQHTPRELRDHESSLSFFTPEAFRYFLPAYMLAELDDPETADVIAEGIAFHVTNSPDEKLRRFTVQELQALEAFFNECSRRYGSGTYQSLFDGAAFVVESVIAGRGYE